MSEAWRERVTPQFEGTLDEAKRYAEAQGWFLRVWRDVKVPAGERVEVWGLPPLVGLLMTSESGERIGLLYGALPTYLKDARG